jgi:hypothetical protein
MMRCLVRLVVIAAVFVSAAACAAPAFAAAENQRCFDCHAKTDLGTVTVNGQERSLTVDPAVWEHSIHSLLDCTACHVGFKPEAHTAEQTQDWYAIASAKACGTCHAGQMTAYDASAHSPSRPPVEGKTRPSCSTCHGAHDIQVVGTQEYRKRVTDRCMACHGGRSATFLDTYHGKAYVLGRPDAATCYDCHGSHAILPQDDPRSTVSSENIVATCAKCHEGANTSFASYKVHVKATDPKSSLIVFSIYSFYVVMIIVVFTFGGIHSVMYFYRGLKEGKYRRSHD